MKNYSGNRLFLTPYDSTDTDLSADIKYSGWVFLKDGVYIQKANRWCGNDTGPREYKGTWSITGLKDDFTLTMVDGKYLMTYKIVELKKDKIVLLKED